jgi:hypothetical protein
MNHLSEEQLIMHYYGEEGDALAAEQHLDECAECRAFYGSLQRVLNVVDTLPIPDLPAEYGAQVWQRLERHIPARRRWGFTLPTWRWVAGAALAGLLVAAFAAGRFYQRPAPMAMVKTDPAAGEKILLVAVGDYLERSQMVLIELANANPKAPLDISAEQERAGDLVSESRLYRQTAAHTGDTNVAGVLDDVDRVLMDIAHGPSQLSPAELNQMRQRLEAEGILLKIRVLSSNVRNHEGTEAKQASGQKL